MSNISKSLISNRNEDRDGIYWFNEMGSYHRTDGPAVMDHDRPAEWWINGNQIKSAATFKRLSGISEEDMFALILKYDGLK